VLKGQGMNKLPPNQAQKGDQTVTFKIAIPDKLNDQQKEALMAYARVEPKLQD
jgi:DnaJ-class molecular chaperone